LLDSLIEVAVKQNYSVQMAMDRIAMAKANLRSAQGSYSPTLGLSAGWTRQQSSGNINQVPKAITQYSSATVDMNWEV
ncbi:TolC family protein, partial [Xanthomonas citri pv. citri]|nr:TolC family protein [Xanthomonas citri pv. citri]